jgi:TonB family protein
MNRAFDSTALAASLLAAAGLHGVALALALNAVPRPGALPRETLAVSLNLVEKMVIEAAAPARAPDAGLDAPAADASAPARPQPQTASVPDPKMPEQAEQTAEPAPPPEPARQPEAATAAETKSELQSGLAPADAVPAPARKPRKPEETTKAPPAPAKAKKAAPAKRKSAPSTPARAKAGKTPKQASASASAGEVRNYAAMVRARIARNRPRGATSRGTAVVAFAISGNGGLRYARLARSSGNNALDGAALRSVRAAAPFPAPPRAMTSRQLSFVIPFRFR